ncbi:MAG: bifunctional DNA-formamidopyrimidine glycosylase/DNA-(apurinic or apyrimidinic site) lyase [Candidatus Eisenbacteria bacterium]
MPELPEVETVRRHLERHVVGRRIESIATSGKALRRVVPAELLARAPGRTILAARRHGKFLLIDLDDGASILAHLGMTGAFLFRPAGGAAVAATPGPHVHVRFTFADGSALWYEDARRFGLLDWAEPGRVDQALGPGAGGVDPMRERLDGARLRRLFARCRGPIKPLLLDQKRIAGIGNIYACEALHRAAIGPRRAVHTLSLAERERLAREIHAVLDRAVEHRGTTFSNFRDPDERPGSYGSELRVYDREGEPCPRCGSAIRRIVQGGRSTFYCAACQTRTAAARL